MKSPIDNTAQSAISQHRGCVAWIFAVTIVMGLRPVGDSEFWWHLARGREVVAGSHAPSRDLLAAETHSDADWLGGVPFYLLWERGTVWAISAIPLLFALAVCSLCWWMGKSHQPAWFWIFCWPLALWGMREGFQPVPAVFDLMGMFGVWWVVSRSARERPVAIFLLFLAWGNLGPRPIWGLLLLAGLSMRRPAGLWTWIAAVLAGMVTPRGPWTWVDSAILFAPQSIYLLPMQNVVGARGLAGGAPWGPPEIAWLALWFLWIGTSWRGMGWRSQLPGLGIPLLAVLLCRENLPESSLWILLEMMAGTSISKATLKERAAPVEAGPSQTARAWWWMPVGGGLVGLLVLADGAGTFQIESRLGVGIAPAIDLRLFNADLLTRDGEAVIIWGPDARSTGLVAWLRGNAVAFDHPRRAWVGGRWSALTSLWNDLRLNREPEYRRENGTWGGWNRQIAKSGIGMLLIPVEDRELHLSLAETSWKPGDLDSPTIPYLSTNAPPYFASILETLAQQHLVEAGNWRPTLSVYDSQGWRWDLIEQMGLGTDPRVPCLQAEIFRMLRKPMAALRALLPVLPRASGFLYEEWSSCQVDLAWQEWTDFGQVSDFRKEVVRALGRMKDLPPPVPGTADEAAGANALAPCVHLYLQGRLNEALNALPMKTAEECFAAAMIALEQGEVARAQAELTRGLDAHPAPGISVALRTWKEDLNTIPQSEQR